MKSILILLLSLVLLSLGKSADRPKLNVVFILIDDMGWTDLGCYGSDYYETPNVDRLAQQGMKFTDAHTTSSVCTPSRFSVMTGRYNFRGANGVVNGYKAAKIKPGRETVASMLKQNG